MENQFAAFVAIDWADQKHAWIMQVGESGGRRGGIIDPSATSERLACSVGGESHRGKSRNPVAWVAFVEETKRMKPIDKAALGAVSESPGRNESEPIGGLDKIHSEGRAHYGRAKAA